MKEVLSVPAAKAAIPLRYRAAARRAFLRVSAFTNAGDRVACPCCGKHVRKFARFHGANDQCPGCGALMRHRAILLYLRDVLRLPERRCRESWRLLPRVVAVFATVHLAHALGMLTGALATLARGAAARERPLLR